MPKQQSIKQKHSPDALPDFRNLGFLFRTVLLVNGIGLLGAFARAVSWHDITGQLLGMLAHLEPILLSSLLLLFALNPLLVGLSYRRGASAVLFAVALAAFAIAHFGGGLYPIGYRYEGFGAWRYVLLSVAIAAILLAYFRLRAHALYPALHEAKLQALQARIRPHFLFNCINTVLSIMRADPKRAETALEDMSDLFRMAMTQIHELVALQDEIELSRRYLDLEKLRLGDRLSVNWRMGGLPTDAMVPPLMLQPLLENAVYHGIEPLQDGGTIDIQLSCHGHDLNIDIRNPRRQQGSHHVGNKLALANIRERLALQFDIEASYTVEAGADFYRVQIAMPYVKREFS